MVVFTNDAVLDMRVNVVSAAENVLRQQSTCCRFINTNTDGIGVSMVVESKKKKEDVRTILLNV